MRTNMIQETISLREREIKVLQMADPFFFFVAGMNKLCMWALDVS